jgi:hypothetical protein
MFSSPYGVKANSLQKANYKAKLLNKINFSDISCERAQGKVHLSGVLKHRLAKKYVEKRKIVGAIALNLKFWPKANYPPVIRRLKNHVIPPQILRSRRLHIATGAARRIKEQISICHQLDQ